MLTLSILATLPTSLFAMSDELSTQGDIDQRGELPTITHTNSSGADADLLREFGSLGFEKIRGIGPEQTERRAPEQTIVAEPAVEVAPVSTAPVKQVVKPLRIIAAMAVKTSEMVGLRKAEPKRQLSSTTKRISNYAVRAKPKFFSVI